MSAQGLFAWLLFGGLTLAGALAWLWQRHRARHSLRVANAPCTDWMRDWQRSFDRVRR